MGASGAEVGCSAKFEFYLAPSIMTLSPLRGPSKGGSMVSLHGFGFREEGLQCRFGGVVGDVASGTARWESSSLIGCVAPEAATGPGPVGVEVSVNDGADFTTDGKHFLYEVGATVEALRPSTGVNGESGQVVTVLGRHFEQTGELS
eukprot:1888226-Rhodomonas_salina.1